MKVISIQVPPAVEHRPANQLRIAGVTRFTTIDFPGFLSAVVFLKGCPWKCLYCQNPELQLKEFSENEEAVSWDYLENFLKKRIGLIDGVVFSGGEPLTDPALYEAVQTAKKLGYKIGLHT
ncbi:radical SAM protein, partial [Turicimonas muris]